MIPCSRFISLVGGLAAAGLLLASCAPALAPTPTPKSVEAAPTKAPAATPAKEQATPQPAAPTAVPKAAGQPKYGGVLPVSIYTDMTSLDPHQESMFATLTLTQPAMNGLLEYDPFDLNWTVRPALAERWEINKEGTRLTFYLRKGVKFHDGKPFTSADARFSLERMGVNPPKGAVLPRQKSWEPVDKIETPDDYTVVLNLKYPMAEIVDAIASGFTLMLPKHIIEPLGSAKIRKIEHTIGTGPFKVQSYDIGVGWRLVKNPDYFKKGLPYLDEIKYYIVKDESTRFGAFRTKSVLLDSKSPGFSPTQKEILEKSPETAGKVVITGGVINSLWGLWMNTRVTGPIGDVRVRKALHLAIDRQKMQRLLSQSQPPGVLGSTMFPGSKFAPPKEEIEKLPGFRQPKDQDVAEAKRLLEEAKYPKDYTMTLITREGGIYRDQVTTVVEELKGLGINTTVKILDSASLYTSQERRDFGTMVYTYSTPNPSPLSVFGDRFVTGGGRNYEGVSDERIDALYAKQERTLDVEERKKLFAETDRILREEIVPVAPFYWASKYSGYWKEVKGYAGVGLGYYEGNSMEEVWLDK